MVRRVPRRWARSLRAVAVAALASLPGCYESEVPLDSTPRMEVDGAWLGTWRCLPFNADADEQPATVRVDRGAERYYAVTWQESGKDPEHYEAFASSVRATPFWNIREVKTTGEKGKWVFLRPSMLRPAVLQVQIVDQDALKGVEPSSAALRRALERKLTSPSLTVDFAVCVRAKEPEQAPAK